MADSNKGWKVCFKIMVSWLKHFNWFAQGNKMIVGGWNYSINQIRRWHRSTTKDMDIFNCTAIKIIPWIYMYCTIESKESQFSFATVSLVSGYSIV